MSLPTPIPTRVWASHSLIIECLFISTDTHVSFQKNVQFAGQICAMFGSQHLCKQFVFTSVLSCLSQGQYNKTPIDMNRRRSSHSCIAKIKACKERSIWIYSFRLKGICTLPAFSHATNIQCNRISSFNYYFSYCGNEKHN